MQSIQTKINATNVEEEDIECNKFDIGITCHYGDANLDGCEFEDEEDGVNLDAGCSSAPSKGYNFERVTETRENIRSTYNSDKMASQGNEYVKFTLAEGVIMNGKDLNVLSTIPINMKVM